MSNKLINGEIYPENEALIPINDLGMLRGYGVFDFFRIIDSIPVFVEDHLDRLYHSIDVMDLDFSYTREELTNMILQLIAKNKTLKGGLRAVVTGGFADDGYTPTTPNLYMMIHELPVVKPDYIDHGCKILMTPFQRMIPSVKTIIYVQSIHYQKKMNKEGAIEVLYQWDGEITECSRSNIFFVDQNDTIITPKNGILKGITRMKVLGLAENKYNVEERDVNVDEIGSMKEAFLTSSTKSVLPLVQINDQVIGNGNPGNITFDLRQDFNQLVKIYIQKNKVA